MIETYAGSETCNTKMSMWCYPCKDAHYTDILKIWFWSSKEMWIRKFRFGIWKWRFSVSFAKMRHLKADLWWYKDSRMYSLRKFVFFFFYIRAKKSCPWVYMLLLPEIFNSVAVKLAYFVRPIYIFKEITGMVFHFIITQTGYWYNRKIYSAWTKHVYKFLNKLVFHTDQIYNNLVWPTRHQKGLIKDTGLL